jgi:hypothetical protein
MHLVGQETGYLSAFGNQVSQTTIANATTVAVRGEELGEATSGCMRRSGLTPCVRANLNGTYGTHETYGNLAH